MSRSATNSPSNSEAGASRTAVIANPGAPGGMQTQAGGVGKGKGIGRQSLFLRLARQPDRRLDWWFALIIAAISFLVFAHTIDGSWVWDDHVQIVGNQQIKDPDLFRRALTTDVWSFRSTQGRNESRYWRPTFVAWMIGVQQIAGTASASLWHLSVVLLHTLASVLAYFVARRVGFGPLWAAPIGLIFAMHPTRVESVAWVSGATDPILAVFMFGALLLLLRVVRAAPMPPNLADRVRPTHYLFRRPLLWFASLLLFAGALGSKEVAILFPVLVFAAAIAYRPRTDDTDPTANRPERRFDRRSILPACFAAMPFVAMSGIYLLLRLALIGSDPRPDEMFLPFQVNIYTLPRVGLFYVWQCLAPYDVSPFYVLSHQIRPDFEGFFLPGLGLLTVGGLMLWIVFGQPRSRAAALGLAMFAAILAPAAYVIHFPPPDQLVHDRYLYIPLLGMLLLLSAVASWLFRRADQAKVAVSALCVGVLACALMAGLTMRYAEAWKQGKTMWGWAVAASPGSMMGWQHYGLELAQLERHEEAQQAYRKAMEIQRSPHGLLVMAESLMAQNQLDQAERMFMFVADRYEEIGTIRNEYYYAIDFVARIRLIRNEDVDGAVEMYQRGLKHLPAYRATLYDRMGMVYIAAQRWDEAEAALNKGLPFIASDAISQARMIHYRLGQVYLRSERLDKAEAEFLTYLSTTEAFDDSQLVDGGILARLALLQIGQLHLQAERLDDAQRLFRIYVDRSKGISVPEIVEGARKARLAIDGIDEIRRNQAAPPGATPDTTGADQGGNGQSGTGPQEGPR